MLVTRAAQLGTACAAAGYAFAGIYNERGVVIDDQ